MFVHVKPRSGLACGTQGQAAPVGRQLGVLRPLDLTCKSNRTCDMGR